MKHFIKLLLLLLPFASQSQENRADSLRQALYTASTDSLRYNFSDKLLGYYYERNRDSALYYAETCLLIAEKNNMSLLVAGALNAIGYQLFNLDRYGESLKCFLRAAKIAENPANEKKVFTLGKDPDLRKKRLYTLANTHFLWGTLMRETTDTTQQIFHYQKARKIAEETGYSGMIGLIDMNLGSIYYGMGKLDSALYLEKHALAMQLQSGNKNYIGAVYRRLGNIYLKKGDKEQAIQNWHMGISSAINRNNQNNLANGYETLASFYLEDKNKDSSLYYARKQFAVLQLMGSKDSGTAYVNLYKSFELNGKKDSAYLYQRLALAASDTALKKKIKNLGDFQKEAFKEQERLQELEQEKINSKNRTRNYSLFTALGVFLVIGLLLYRNNRQKQKANLVLKEQKQKVESTLLELKSTQSQLIQSEKMASLGELTAGIAHEIQNPLNFVNNFSEVNAELIEEMVDEVKKGNTSEAESIANDIKQNLEKINHHGKRADAIVKGMLQHSRSSSGVKEPTDINALCDEYLRLSYHGLRAKDKSFNAMMKTDFDNSIGNINIIPQDIGRVVLNLINNAFYVVDEKKKQTVEGYEPTVTVSTKKINGKVEIKVADNGNGIPQKVLDKIFQPFFTTKPAGQGTGLGLSLSYDIIKAHGGEIEVKTKEGEGSEFIILIPNTRE